jgi:23S rRNA (uracil1939-C5)-methyltransferase
MVYQSIHDIMKSSSLQAFDVQTGTGEIRHILIKTAVATKEVLVILVSAHLPSDEIKKVASKIIASNPSVKGVVHNYNPKQGNTVLGSVYTTLAGNDAIEDVLCGLSVNVSPASFFQVNPLQAQSMYAQSLLSSEVSSDDTVLDAYCGVGTMSLLFAQHAKKVIGIELVEEAILDAKRNAIKNAIHNTEFHAAAVEDYILMLDEKIDIVILNPPRKGCEPSVIEKVGALDLKKIIYISCDPATLARDLQLLSLHGWKIQTVQPFDMFPQTSHVETLVALSR